MFMKDWNVFKVKLADDNGAPYEVKAPSKIEAARIINRKGTPAWTIQVWTRKEWVAGESPTEYDGNDL